MPRRPKLQFTEVKSLRDALALRSIRNECSEYMTNDTGNLGFFHQIYWFYFKYPKSGFVCYIGQIDNLKIAYGLIRTEGPWVTGGVKKSFRGFGFGEDLFTFLTDTASHIARTKRVYLEVQDSNHVAFKLYQKLGYTKEGKRGGILIMRKDL